MLAKDIKKAYVTRDVSRYYVSRYWTPSHKVKPVRTIVVKREDDLAKAYRARHQLKAVLNSHEEKESCRQELRDLYQRIFLCPRGVLACSSSMCKGMMTRAERKAYFKE